MKPLADIRPDQQHLPFAQPSQSRWQHSEALVASILGGQLMCTQAGRWCPDVKFYNGFAEVKSIKHGRSLSFFESQIEAFRERDDYYLAVVLPDRIVFVPSAYVRWWIKRKMTSRTIKDGRTLYSLPWGFVRSAINARDTHRGRVEVGGSLVPWYSRCDLHKFEWWPERYRSAAKDMLHDMQVCRHEVVLTPLKGTNRKARTVVDTNPQWYADLCAAHPTACRAHKQKPSTDVNRQKTINFLTKVSRGEFTLDRSEEFYLPAIEQAMREYEEHVEPLALDEVPF